MEIKRLENDISFAEVHGYQSMGNQRKSDGQIIIGGEVGAFPNDPKTEGVQPGEGMTAWEKRSNEKFTREAADIYRVLSNNLPGGTLHALLIQMLQGKVNLYVVQDVPLFTPDVERALQIAREDGGIDGAHHKTWAIDQMVRALTGPGYAGFVEDAKRGEDGPETYSWDEGIAP